MSDAIPAFEPHPWLRSSDAQTIAGRYLPGPAVRVPSTYHELPLADGDRLTALDSRPPGWRPGDPVVVLIHGLGGCARAPYVRRLAAAALGRGYRAVRMNLRGAGSGFGAARGIYHSGRTEDLRTVLTWAAGRSPGSPVALVGYSLGAHLTLRLAAEAAADPVPGLDCVLAANPPIDLAVCCRIMREPRNRIYDKNFVRSLRAEVGRLHAAFPELGPTGVDDVQTLFDFDDRYTSRRNGYDGAEDYYSRCSSAPLIPRITLPGLVVHAEDDPFIPAAAFRQIEFPETLALELIPGGGHLGYISRRPWQGHHRWLDGRLLAWLAARWSSPNGGPGAGVRLSRIPVPHREGGLAAHV